MGRKLTEATFDESAALGAPENVARSPWVVLKFGGTSVSTRENWETIAGLVQARLDAGLRPVVAHSALSGISNALEKTLDDAVQGDPSEGLALIRERHLSLAKDLGLDGEALLAERLHELEQLFAGVRLIKEVSVRVRVRVMALGELMSTCLGAAFLESQGLPARWMDARDLLTSRSRPGRNPASSYLSATCDYSYNEEMESKIAEHDGVVVTQGFIARNTSGETVCSVAGARIRPRPISLRACRRGAWRSGPTCQACSRQIRKSCRPRGCSWPCAMTRPRNSLRLAAR